jgi:spore maturation protein CgeB
VNYVFLGLSITSAWGNGHATTYRSLIRELSRRGHTVTFLERDVSWYAEHRDLPVPEFCTTYLYRDPHELQRRYLGLLREADVVVVGSYVPDGIEVARTVLSVAKGITAFYDIDTPITLSELEGDGSHYLSRSLVPRFDLYLSFTGGPTLERLERRFGARMARPLYCSVDPELYYPEEQRTRWSLGYLGTYSVDRQPALEELLLRPAALWSDGAFVVAGAQYPEWLVWPATVARMLHVPPGEHRAFYNSQRFTLNITRAEMVRAGYSPSVRLFEAAACGTPIISDAWPGLGSFFVEGREILIGRTAKEVVGYLRELSEAERSAVAEAARARVLTEHTAASRALQFDEYVAEAREGRSRQIAINGFAQKGVDL